MPQIACYKDVERKFYACRFCGEQIFWRWDHRTKKRSKWEIQKDERESPHECSEGDIRPAKCRYCGSQDLFWVKREGKYELTEGHGLPHVCDAFSEVNKAHKEALKEEYQWQKKWVNSHPDDSKCTLCKGTGYRLIKHRKLRPGCTELAHNYRPCRKCKHIGTFTKLNKFNYLKDLRKKFWPWKPHFKWKAYNAP